MIDAIKVEPATFELMEGEVSCTQCLHQEVCKYKQDFLDICNAVSSSTVNRPCEDGKKVQITPVTNFDCFCDIYVCCRYYHD